MYWHFKNGLLFYLTLVYSNLQFVLKLKCKVFNSYFLQSLVYLREYILVYNDLKDTPGNFSQNILKLSMPIRA